MEVGKSKQNMTGLAVFALIAFYVGSYGLTRFNSASLPMKSGKRVILLGTREGHLAVMQANFTGPSSKKIQSDIRSRQMIYTPLRWIEHWLTGVDI